MSWRTGILAQNKFLSKQNWSQRQSSNVAFLAHPTLVLIISLLTYNTMCRLSRSASGHLL